MVLQGSAGKPKARAETMDYLVKLIKQLTPEQALAVEIRWRDPLGVLRHV